MATKGIYRIRIDRGARPPSYYIGQTVDCSEREQQHLRAMRAGRHDNDRMQRSFAKYGESAFQFSMIVICGTDVLTIYEQAILDFYLKTYGDAAVLNVMRECVRSHVGVKRRPETIKRMSCSQKGRPKPRDQIAKMAKAMKGKRHSEETREHLSLVHKGMMPHPNSLAALQASRNSPIRIANISVGKRASAYVHSELTKAKISASLMGRKQSPEMIEKRIAPLRGRKRSSVRAP